jgi:type VI secretion system FHA domain protein
MDLNLTVIRYQNLPSQGLPGAIIGVAGGTIGRSPDNDLVLPDPERWVSGHHARIDFRNGSFYITDTSKNGTFVNHVDEPLREGQEAKLHDGDELGIGVYEVRVSLAAAEAQAAPPFDPFASSEPEPEPVAGLPPAEAAPDILDLVGPDQPAGGPSLPGGPEDKAPTDLENWLVDEPEAAAPLAPGAPPTPADIPEVLAEPDHIPDEAAFFSPPDAVPEDYDILADESRPATDGDSERRESRDVFEPPADEAGPFVSPPEPQASGATGADAAEREAQEPGQPRGGAAGDGTRRTAAGPLTAGTNAELDAFLAGLGGGELPLDPAARARLLQTAGELLRTMIDGLMQVMMARARFKSELRLEMTAIRSRENNPFKFSADPDDALDHLLFRPSRGFLPPREAALEAFGDIQRHEMAIVAGLRAALRALLASMDPGKLERRFEDRSVFDNLLPMARKAKYWDLFTETYDEVAADAEEDFLHLFGEAFTGAYEEQTSRLKKAGSHKAPPDYSGDHN